MILSHWYTLLDATQLSSQAFYQSLEAAIDRRQIPGLARSRVLWPEGGLLSAKRWYLRLTREKLLFDICAAPFGTSFFISWRLVDRTFPWALVFAAMLLIPCFFALIIVFLTYATQGTFAATLVFGSCFTWILVTAVAVAIAIFIIRKWFSAIDGFFVRQNTLSVTSGKMILNESANVDPNWSSGSDAKVSIIRNLSFAGTGSLDVKNNDLILDSGTTAAALEAMVASGYNHGAWNGPGLVSSDARAHNIFTLLVLSNANPFTKLEQMFKAKPARKVIKVRPLKALKDMAK